MLDCCEFGIIGASRGLDLENPKHRFASSNHRARRKSSEIAPTEVTGAGGTGGSQSPWHSGIQPLKLAVEGSLGAFFSSEVSYVNFFQMDLFQLLLLKQTFLVAFSSGLPLPLFGLCITKNSISTGPEGRLKPSYICTLCSVPDTKQVK